MNVLNNTDLIPIGTICYRAGSLNKCTEEIVADNNNQNGYRCFGIVFTFQIRQMLTGLHC